MTVKKCDVCGGIYKRGDYNPLTSARIKLKGQKVEYSEQNRDLCYNCTEALLSWLVKRRWNIKENKEKDGGSNG